MPMTLVLVLTVCTLFGEGWNGSKRGLRHEAPPSQSGD
jgi:hypothetical protein